MAGDAREKNMPDRVSYADWSAKIVRDQLHKGGWRLADLLTLAVGSTSIASTAATASAEPTIAPPGKPESTAAAPPPIASSTAPSKGSASASDFGVYPTNYKEIVAAWLKKYGLDASRIDWQGEPKPAEMPNASGQRFAGYLVIFNTPDRGAMKTRSVLIRDGVVVSNSGF